MNGGVVTEITAGGRLNILGSCCSTWTAGSNATLINNGTLHFSGGNGVNLGANFKLDNNGTFEIASTSSIVFHDTATTGTVRPLITNSGTIISAVSGDRSIYVPVWNKTGGVIKSDLGTITLHSGNSSNPSSGSFSGVVFQGTHQLSDATLTGSRNRFAGTVTITQGATTTVASGLTTMGGLITGPGKLLVQGTLDWPSGEMVNSAVTEIAPGGRINILGSCCSTWTAGSNATLINNGTLHFSGGNGVKLGTNFRIDNNGTFEMAGTAGIVLHDSAATGTVRPLIANAGSIINTVSSDKAIYVPVWNKTGGVIKSDVGTISLYGGTGSSPSSGTYGGGVILNGAHALSNATFTGTRNRLAGPVTLPQATTTTIASGSTATTGSIAGPGKLLVQGTLEWTNGEMYGAAVTEIAPGGRINLVGSCCSTWTAGSNATLINNGTLHFSGSNGVNLGTNFRIDNNGTFEMAGKASVVFYDTAAAGTTKPSITNTGTIVSTVSGDKSIYAPAWNKTGGVIKSDLGTITLYGGSGGSPSSGTFAGGVVLRDTYHLSNATFTGTRNSLAGTVALTQGSMTTIASGSTSTTAWIKGPGKLLIQGTLDWTYGEMNSSTVTEIAPGGRLNIVGSCCSTWTAGSNATLINNGTLHFSGSNGVNLGTNLRIENNGTFEMAGSASIVFHDTAAAGTTKPSITNTGTIVSTVSGDKSIYAPVWNKTGGVIKSDLGTITLHGGSGGSPSSGTFAGGVVLIGTHDLLNATFTGTRNRLGGTHALAQGTTTMIASGSTTMARSITGPGKLLVRGTLDWDGGELRSGASVYVASDGRLNITHQGCCGRRPVGSNATVVNDGLMSIAGGEGLAFGDAFEIYNNGRLEWLPTSSSVMDDNSTTTKPLIANAGLFVKQGTNTGTISVPVENDGTISVEAGALSVNGRFRPYIRARSVLAEGEYVLKGALRVAGLNVVRNAARITLDGQGGVLADQTGANALTGLTRNAGGGRLTLKNGASLSTFGPVRNAGKVLVDAGSTLTTPGYTQTRGATVVEAPNSTLSVGTNPGMSIVAGSLRGVGVIQGNVTNASGAVMPGSATTPGQLSVQGNYTQGTAGSLDLDVAGTASADKLSITGSATLAGRLMLVTSSSYIAAVGDLFTLMAYGSQTGAFGSVMGTSLSDGRAYSVQLQPQSATAVVQ